MDTWVALAIGAVVGAAAVGIVASVRSGRRVARHDARMVALRDSLDEQVRASRATLQIRDTILSSMQDGVLLVGPDGQVAFMNGALERHLGMRPISATQLFPVSLHGSIELARRGRAPDSILVEVGEPPRSLRVITTPAGDQGDVLMVVRDVTEARRIDAIRRDFVANASHELKTPAASIQAAAETIRHAADDDPAAVPRFAAQLEREAVRLSRIVADLLDLSRLESGSDLSEQVRLDALAREEIRRYEEAAREAGISLGGSTHEAATVRGSARDLSLMIRNLVDNAIRYTRDGGTVHVEVADGDPMVQLSVSDTGVGIPSKDLPRVFERFYRIDRARSRETGGTGLGLAIVKHVAENHGGTVSVDSELGRGTTVVVELPRDLSA